jgi:hypothetical protein
VFPYQLFLGLLLTNSSEEKEEKGITFVWFKTHISSSNPSDKAKWELKMLSDRLVELKVVEHISVTMVRRLLKKIN